MKTKTHRLLFILLTLLVFEKTLSQEIGPEIKSEGQSQIEEEDNQTILISQDAIEDTAPEEDSGSVLNESEAEIQKLNAQLSSKFESQYELDEHRNKWIFQYRYLGVLSQIGIERALGGQISAGLYYGRYAGKVAGTDKLGFIPDLEHMALQLNAYLNGDKVALGRGLVARFALHVNRQKENDLVKSIQVDGVDVIIPGQTKVGTLLGIGYQYNWKMISLNAGMEYLTMGPLKSFVPLAIGVGITF